MKRRLLYDEIDWISAHRAVFLMQQEIAVAYNLNDKKLVHKLQERLVRSFASRAISVRRVATNSGNKTSGVDNVIWNTKEKTMLAINELKDLRHYIAKPVRRVFIPKKDRKLRPLGIPTMFDRAVQALYALSLAPIAECIADTRSYGFRPYHGVHDAAIYIKLVLGSYTNNKRYILEGDISKFFDKISHDWFLENIPMDKRILTQFLKAGFMEGKQLHLTTEGIPQGGVISPMIANMALDGLELLMQKNGFIAVRYADDFVVFGETEDSLRFVAMPLIETFLSIRGLQLNVTKTLVTSMVEGFDFLGFNFREYADISRVIGTKKGIFLVKPTSKSVINIRAKIKNTIRDYRNKPMYMLVTKLNQVIRGWAEHYRTVTSKKIFTSTGAYVWNTMWAMLKRKHRRMPSRLLKSKYFKSVDGNHWVFFCPDSKNKVMTLFQIGWVSIKRHSICKSINPFLPENEDYFKKRKLNQTKHSLKLSKKALRLASNQGGICVVCKQPLINEEVIEIHHVIPRKRGGSDVPSNLKLLHKACHKQVTYSKSIKLRAAWLRDGIISC